MGKLSEKDGYQKKCHTVLLAVSIKIDRFLRIFTISLLYNQFLL